MILLHNGARIDAFETIEPKHSALLNGGFHEEDQIGCGDRCLDGFNQRVCDAGASARQMVQQYAVPH